MVNEPTVNRRLQKYEMYIQVLRAKLLLFTRKLNESFVNRLTMKIWTHIQYWIGNYFVFLSTKDGCDIL